MNVGIVGIKGFGGTYLNTIAKRPRDRVIALCDLDAQSLAAMADAHGVGLRFTEYERMLAVPELDAVFIATPHFLHHPMTMAALRCGKHVFCEKPLAITAAHADEMARTARELGLVLTCHFNQRARDYVARLRGVVGGGAVGRPYHVNARWMARWTGFMFDERTNWRLQHAKSGGGIFIGRGSHLIDAVLYVLDFPRVLAVSATMHHGLCAGDVDDFATALLRLEGGTTVSVQCSYVAHLPYADRMEYEVFGPDGGAFMIPGAGGPGGVVVGRTRMHDGVWEDLAEQVEAGREPRPGTTVIDDFLDAIAERREPLVTGEQAAHVTRIIEAGYLSASTGQEVCIGPA